MLWKIVLSAEDFAVPLLDHFHPPLYPQHAWESFHANWATKIADALTDLLPPEFLVEEHIHLGPAFEIDVAAIEKDDLPENSDSGGVLIASRTLQTYSPPAPHRTIAAAFPDTFEIRIFNTTAGLTLVGAVELVSPGNKDRVRQRRAFATKCASYLASGVSLVVVDVVTSRRANLHNETVRLMEAAPDLAFPRDVSLYAVAYRPVQRRSKDKIDLWLHPLALGAPLPTLPLRLTGDLLVPVDLEATYTEACRRRRLA
jgi:hypothetical protein